MIYLYPASIMWCLLVRVWAPSVKRTLLSDGFLTKFQQSYFAFLHIRLIYQSVLLYIFSFIELPICRSSSFSFSFLQQDIPKPCNSKGCNESLLDFMSCNIKASMICLCCMEKRFWCWDSRLYLRGCSRGVPQVV